ncbi:adenylate kinase, partial [Bienertia sinuspersici]
MDATCSNDTIIQQLKNGSAQFELVSSPVASISQLNPESKPIHLLQNNSNCAFFARIGHPLGGVSQSNIKVEHYTVQKVAGDGR